MTATIKARFDDPQGSQESQAVNVEGAAYALVAFQNGGPHDVSVLSAASEAQFLCLLRGVTSWGLAAGFDENSLVAAFCAALSRPQ